MYYLKLAAFISCNVKTSPIKANKKYLFFRAAKRKMDSVALWSQNGDERLERKIIRDGVDLMELTDAT